MIDSYEIQALAQAKRPKQPPPETGLTVYDLAGGGTLTIRHPPGMEAGDEMTYEQREVARIVHDALEGIGKLDAQRRAVQADRNLSDVGRQEKLKFWEQSARVSLGMAEAELVKVKRAAEEMASAVLEPPTLDKADLVGALHDQELRTWIRTAPEKERVALLTALSGEPRMLHALLRSSVKIPGISDHARRIWDEHIEATHPHAPRVRAYQDAMTWVSETLPQIRNAVT